MMSNHLRVERSGDNYDLRIHNGWSFSTMISHPHHAQSSIRPWIRNPLMRCLSVVCGSASCTSLETGTGSGQVHAQAGLIKNRNTMKMVTESTFAAKDLLFCLSKKESQKDINGCYQAIESAFGGSLTKRIPA